MAKPVAAKITTEGFQEIIRELKQLEGDAEKVIRSGVRAGAVRVKKDAQQNLSQHRQTGQLADSLKVSTRINRRRRSVVSTVRNTRDTFYGLFLEFGTIRISPVRWLTRAIRGNAQTIMRKDVAPKIRARLTKVKAKRS